MALDFSQVKEIQVPVVVQPTADWYELSLDSNHSYCYFPSSDSDAKPLPLTSFCNTANGTGNNPLLRIYFTWSGASRYSYTFAINEETVSSLSSPIEITFSTSTSKIITITQIDTNYPTRYRKLYLYGSYNYNNDRVSLSVSGIATTGLNDEFRLTITKIEQYYLPDPTPYIVNKRVKKIENSLGNVLWIQPYTLYENYYLTSHSYDKDTNYIDLGVKWNNNWKLECKFYKPTTTSQWGRLLGTGYDTNREVYINYDSEYNGNFVVNYGNKYVSSLSDANTINTEYNFSFGNRGSVCECWFLKPGGSWQSFGTTWSPSNTKSSYNLRLFSNPQGDRDGIFGIGKIQINGPSDLWTEEGALMLLVPARRNSDNVLGMYDKNHDVFYPVTTSGNGYFTITDVNGNVIN